jgi:Tfp pilus assembly protein PilF
MKKPFFLLGLVLVILVGIFLFRSDFHLLIHDIRAHFTSEPTVNSPPPPSIPATAPISAIAPPPMTSPAQEETPAPAMNSFPTSSSPESGSGTFLLHEAYKLMQLKQPDAALDKVNAALQADPKNEGAFVLRGSIYAQKKLWDMANKDYQSALRIDGKNARIKFDLAEMDFVQKKYNEARASFVGLEQDPDIGDLATYKVFLCDLFGGHEDVAAKELDAFNQVGSNASYYFANVAWSAYHHKTEDARGWLRSAASIYAPTKFRLYATSLVELGYLPLPPPPP